MKQMTLKTMLIGAILFFTGWQSFAQGSIDSVYVLANNKIQFSIPASSLSTGDSVAWYLNGTAISAGTGISIEGADYSTLKIDGSLVSAFQQPTDSLTATEQIISVIIYNAGGCYSEDTSKYRVQVLPYLPRMTADWVDATALCMQNSINGNIEATKPTLTGTWSSVSIGDITWWNENTTTSGGTNQLVDGTGGITITATTATSTLTFPTPTDTDAYEYWAQANYDLPGTLIVSAANNADDAQSISNRISIQAAPTPAAPVLNGSTSVSGW